ncbi:MAG: histidinol-phosphate transaminase [candidate division KSB1 bacterium]|nr:histidinol-phosphate transaminase [candidate division KSB1 bacterium]MDZ7274863.1 histidinol-phosphate transaminase [candidate division KSB1 bacterium]MDZ7286685.1 histidinol-phosphate transaminase [candidate division KSB1 bacterium]MDZ7299152.1 histidinol-phosphate transaminase [candidate division KSB1 bacterium]MDZ7307038.1 histidinol-phosphate transaminase [candidate division KSB1 bacterium]
MTPDLSYFIKPEVQSAGAYTLQRRSAAIKLDQNENPFGFPEAWKEEFWQRVKARAWERYPDFHHEELTAALADYNRLPAEQILVGNGSNSLIQALLMVTVSRGVAVVIPQPTFSLYKLTVQILSGLALEVRLNRRDFSLPVERVLEAANRMRARMIILCSPNNPTGVAYPQPQIEEIFAEFPGLVVVDEAYVEFARQDFRPLLQRYENLILLRTFSKALALANCRVGYLMAHADLVREIRKAALPYNINLFSETAALVALAHREELLQRVQEVVREREQLLTRLRQMTTLRLYPSQANFFLAEFQEPVQEVFAHLQARGILVRDVSHYPMLEQCLRLSIGTPAENEKVAAALQEVL